MVVLQLQLFKRKRQSETFPLLLCLFLLNNRCKTENLSIYLKLLKCSRETINHHISDLQQLLKRKKAKWNMFSLNCLAFLPLKASSHTMLNLRKTAFCRFKAFLWHIATDIYTHIFLLDGGQRLIVSESLIKEIDEGFLVLEEN